MDQARPSPVKPSPGELPTVAREFVVQYVSSVAELEALLLLRQPMTESWTAESLARRLYISAVAAQGVLDALLQGGFVIKVGDSFRFAPAREELRTGLDAVAQAYPRFLIAITQLIHERPTSAPRRFAEAFRFRQDR